MMRGRDETFFLIGIIVGAVGMAALSIPARPYWSSVFYVETNHQKAMTVKPDGKIEFGPAYTADTLRQLLDGLKSLHQRQTYGVVDCHETAYRFPFGDPAADGVIRIYPGTAPQFPPPRLASDL